MFPNEAPYRRVGHLPPADAEYACAAAPDPAAIVALADASAHPQAFKDAKRETARFYYARVLPRTLTHAAAIASGAAPLMALDSERFDA